MMMTVLAAAALTATSTGAPAPGRLAPEVSKEMMAAIVATNKALGLESWPMHDVKPCIDRGGQGITAKDVTPDDARRCAASALAKDFPGLGKSYLLAVTMAAIGPVTVLAIGIGDGEGWAAYSCDPDRKCLPVKLGGTAKWSKRVTERLAHTCADAATLWFPPEKRACPDGAPASTAPASSPPASAAPTRPATAPPPATH